MGATDSAPSARFVAGMARSYGKLTGGKALRLRALIRLGLIPLTLMSGERAATAAACNLKTRPGNIHAIRIG